MHTPPPNPPAGAQAALAPLPQLVLNNGYTPCDWDLGIDPKGASHWLGVFDRQWPTIARAAVQSGYHQGALDAAHRDIAPVLAGLCTNPGAIGRLDILALDRLRDGALRSHGIDDAFAELKRRETDAALSQLPARLQALGDLDGASLEAELFRGVMAGNLFDMGASATASIFESGAAPAFGSFLKKVPPRPWLYDGAARIDCWNKVVYFVDNAGADAVLGALPLAAALATHGAEVVLAANSRPSLNDITAPELVSVLDRVPDPIASLVSKGSLRVVPTGTGDPLIDLSALGGALCNAARGADLIVLEGMGRALESNWAAAFSCHAWRLAIIKDPGVADRRGGAMYDCVLRTESPGSHAGPSPRRCPP